MEKVYLSFLERTFSGQGYNRIYYGFKKDKIELILGYNEKRPAKMVDTYRILAIRTPMSDIVLFALSRLKTFT